MRDNTEPIVITNYHAFKPRERIELSPGGRALLQGRGGDELETLETDSQMLQRVMPDLMGMKNILVINDEAHHCYRLGGVRRPAGRGVFNRPRRTAIAMAPTDCPARCTSFGARPATKTSPQPAPARLTCVRSGGQPKWKSRLNG